ncbi:hypothetical protein [Paenibacillus pseudetheri]|uniref:Uncharacterized protein n=1 Tax=Paenibacillus pseudetheri TaxID=2897682 RepID=A0ABM9BDV1_9BACL|nr:hypothetical protein [Paenibacillus pseudetheri]CAH1056880.1 hypothetical protein PAECIP111894_03035 [Paenibacillus pseudetheri]
MRIIFTYQDLKVLRHAKAIPQALLDLVQDYFNQLRVELEDKAKSEFIPMPRKELRKKLALIYDTVHREMKLSCPFVL